MTKKNNPYGDDGGARVGKPDTPQRDNKGKGPLGAGMEPTGGVEKKGKPKAGTDKGSGYGGKMGGPKTSSDQR